MDALLLLNFFALLHEAEGILFTFQCCLGTIIPGLNTDCLDSEVAAQGLRLGVLVQAWWLPDFIACLARLVHQLWLHKNHRRFSSSNLFLFLGWWRPLWWRVAAQGSCPIWGFSSQLLTNGGPGA